MLQLLAAFLNVQGELLLNVQMAGNKCSETMFRGSECSELLLNVQMAMAIQQAIHKFR